MDDESEEGSFTEPISLLGAAAAEPKTQQLAGRAYPLLLRILFRDDPSSQLAARSASQLAGRSAHLHDGESHTLVPELRELTSARAFKGGTSDLVALLALRVALFALAGGLAVVLGKKNKRGCL